MSLLSFPTKQTTPRIRTLCTRFIAFFNLKNYLGPDEKRLIAYLHCGTEWYSQTRTSQIRPPSCRSENAQLLGRVLDKGYTVEVKTEVCENRKRLRQHLTKNSALSRSGLKITLIKFVMTSSPKWPHTTGMLLNAERYKKTGISMTSKATAWTLSTQHIKSLRMGIASFSIKRKLKHEECWSSFSDKDMDALFDAQHVLGDGTHRYNR